MPKQMTRRKPKPGGKRKKIRLWIYLLILLGGAVLIWWIAKPTPVKDPHTDVTAQGEEAQTGRETYPEVPEIVADNKLELAIKEAAIKLLIPENSVRKRVREADVLFSLPINRGEIDLTFANMIVKGQVELQGGKLESGTETGSRQILVFSHPEAEKPHQVEIYYDSAVYRDRSTGKRIAIVVDDFGSIGGTLLDGFFTLDRAVSFAIFPGMQHSEQTMNRAQAQGRESLIHVPMEPIGYPRVDPGPEAILVRMTDSEIERMLNRFINQMPQCVGINNHMGSLATADETTMAAVMKVLRERGKYFLDSRTTNVSVAYQMAQKAHIPAYQNKIFLDSPDISNATHQAKLAQIIYMAQSNPDLIAITHCHNQAKLDYLKRFIRSLEEAGFSLVPLSQIGQQSSPQIL